MAYTLKDAKNLCTKAEYEFVHQAHAAKLATTPAARLRQKMSRARKLRDKYRDESARQRREARGKAEPRGVRAAKGNIRTVLKAEIFADVLNRVASALDEQIAHSTQKATQPVKKTASKKAAKKTTKKTAKKSPAKKSAQKAAKKPTGSTKKKIQKKTAKKTTKKSGKKATKKTAKKVVKKSGTTSAAKATPTKTPRNPSKMSMKPVREALEQSGVLPVGTASSTGPRKARPRRVTKNQAAAKGPAGETNPPSAIEARFAEGGAGRFKGHASERTRRGQAKRDKY